MTYITFGLDKLIEIVNSTDKNHFKGAFSHGSPHPQKFCLFSPERSRDSEKQQLEPKHNKEATRLKVTTAHRSDLKNYNETQKLQTSSVIRFELEL